MPQELTPQRRPVSAVSIRVDGVDTLALAEAWMSVDRGDPVPVKTKFLRLRQPVELGHRIDGWRVCWVGGWDRQQIFYVVMVSRVKS